VRDIMFRTNFLLQSISSVSWTLMNVGFYLIVFHHTPLIGPGSGWGKYEFFVFLATTWLINSLVQTFFMSNADEYSELIRTGNLDFALLKPIDTQFLVSFQKMDWSALSTFTAGIILLSVALWQLATRPENPITITPWMLVLYVIDEYLAGAEPDAVRLLVLHHQFRPLPDGNL
jgi:ABC-2 type transport system permease protein